MATTHTLSGNIFKLARAPFGAKDLSVSVVTNLPHRGALVDKTTNGIYLGGFPADVNSSTGDFTSELIDTSATDLNVAANTLEYEVRAVYVDPATGIRSTWTSGWFPFTADANLADIVTDVEPIAVQSASSFAQDAADSAALARSISEIDTTDAAIKTSLELPGSQSGEYLSATYATRKSDAADEIAGFGPELISGTGWTLGAGWTGSYAAGFTHTPGGGTASLAFPLPSTGTKTYFVEFMVDSATDSSAFTVTIGGSFGPVMYEGANGGTWTYRRGITSVTDGTLTFTPESAFDGRIHSVSVREVTSATAAPFSYEDSTGADAMELRFGQATLDNLFMGKDAGRYNVSGKENAVLGHKAMRANVSGFWNAGIGHQALEANVNGSRNAVLGYLALQSNISGHRNVGIGSFALRSNTHGINNIGIGADAVWMNTTGSYNIGIGLASLSESVTGDANIAIGVASGAAQNGVTGAVGVGYYTNALLVTTTQPPVAVGYRALRDATVGGNVAVGHEASRLNTTGTGNVSVGYQAGYANLTGSQQTAMGYEALRYFTGGRNTALGYGAMKGVSGSSTGTRNVVVGDSAGVGMTSGSNNVVVGGSSGSTLTSGTGNILIGFNVQAPSAADNNALNIGNTIYGNVSTKRVGFGTVTAPTARVHLPASTTAASSAPLKIDPGTLMTTPEVGAIEFDGTNLYFTTQAGVRKTLATV